MDELRSITIQDMKPKLTLRDLFWLILVCGLALGWWLHSGLQEKRHRQEVDEADRWWEEKFNEETLVWSKALNGFRLAIENEGYTWELRSTDGKIGYSIATDTNEVKGIILCPLDAEMQVQLAKKQ